MPDVAEQVRTYIAKHLLFSSNGYGYNDDASLLDEGIIDSVGIIELVTFVESRFQFSVLDEELVPDNFDSITKLTSYIGRKRDRAD